ncbi:MAG: sulfotransferase family 2 domain-containing protein [Pleurocapsa sp.]
MNSDTNNQLEKQAVIFLHLPKSGGTTLSDILIHQYDQDTEIYQIDGTNFLRSQQNFKQLPQSEKEKIKLLIGHMYFGLHEFIPSNSTYVTMLRNPIDRVISYYFFIKKLKNHPDYKLINSNNISLKEYCTLGRENMTNGQTRFLSGMSPEQSGFGGAKMLDKAKKNLEEKFSVVGIMEYFDESLIVMKRKLAWQKNPFYYRRNTNRNNIYKQFTVSSETMSTIKQYNKLDILLYQYAYKLFEQQIKEQNNLDFQLDLKTFKVLNNIYGKYAVFAKKIFKN